MGLRPDLEAKVVAAEKESDTARNRAHEALVALEAAAALEAQHDAVPAETFDDPSVVRHVDELRQTAQRMRRESGTISPPLRKVASGYLVMRPRNR